MLEIRTDISSLTKDQREQLAGFILTFDMPRQAELPFTNKFDPTPQENASAEQFFSEDAVKLSDIVNVSFKNVSSIKDHTCDIESPSPEAVFAPESAVREALKATPVPPPPPTAISPAGPHLVIGSVAVDKSGLPWDERIHASSKNLTAEGLWRKKRGVGEKAVAETAVAPPPPTVSTYQNPTNVPLEAAPSPPAIPAINTEGKAMYIKLIGDTTAAVGAKKATQEDFKSIALVHGVPSIPLLIQHLDKIQAVADDCYALIASRG